MKSIDTLKSEYKYWEITKDLIDQCIDIVLNLSQSGHPEGSVDQIITESRLDSLSILNAVKRFSDERDKRLGLIKKDIPNY